MIKDGSRIFLTSALLAIVVAQPALASTESGTTPGFIYSEHTAKQLDLPTLQLGAAHAVSLTSELHSVYSQREIVAIHKHGPWLSDNGISPNAQVLIRAIQDAKIHGLQPESYGLNRILSVVDNLNTLDEKRAADASPQKTQLSNDQNALRFSLNQLLDTNFIKLVEHLGKGIVDGKSNQKQLYRDAPEVNAFNLLVSVSDAQLSVHQVINSVAPKHEGYKRLTQVMRDLLTEQSTGIQRTKVATADESPIISKEEDKQQIRTRLLETGDLSFEANMASNSDAELLKALRAFQSRHGIEPSNIADTKTRAALNKSVNADIDSVALNLERWRWLPRDLGDSHIFVNIPEFQIDLVVNNKTTLTMPGVVGKYRHQTPSFSEDMSYMEFNPTWTVPVSITNAELIPKERKNPGYLESRQFDFLKVVGNKVTKVPRSSITPEEFNAPRFPYTLRQRGGSINALGRMKFMMPNKYSIYLHDTQSQKHFTLNERAYSHGCIRLSDPDALAQHLMANDGYSQKEIDAAFASKRTHRIKFRQPIPTHLVYLTTWVDENNVLQHRPDIYRNDQKLLESLRTADTLLSSLTDASSLRDKSKSAT